jgi:hypothetical protein
MSPGSAYKRDRNHTCLQAKLPQMSDDLLKQLITNASKVLILEGEHAAYVTLVMVLQS